MAALALAGRPPHPGTPGLILPSSLGPAAPAALGHSLPRLHRRRHHRLQGLNLPKQDQNHEQSLRDPPSQAGMQRLPPPKPKPAAKS